MYRTYGVCLRGLKQYEFHYRQRWTAARYGKASGASAVVTEASASQPAADSDKRTRGVIEGARGARA